MVRRFFWFGMLAMAAAFLSSQAERVAWAEATTEVTFPANIFKDGKARFYDYKTKDGITIKYFLLKSSDGVIRVAFDACDVCWPEGKGYAQKGDTLVCRNCGKRFATIRIGEVKGGCNPAPLARMVVGDVVIIKGKDLLEGKRYFNFSKKGAK